MQEHSFDHPNKFGRGRALLVSTQGMVATSQPLASLTGVRILQEGGNAIDAAVAAAALLCVIEPMSTGLGGDGFAIVYEAGTGQTYGLNASGCSAHAATLESYLAQLGPHKSATIPGSSILAATVPGVVSGWEALATRFGKMPLNRLLEPAITAAEQGFAVSPHVARAWAAGRELLSRHPDSARTWFLPGGRVPRTAEIFRNSDLARTLRRIAEGGSEVFYHGELGSKIVQFVEASGGMFTRADFADHRHAWVNPISADYRGCQILEMPPNGQGVAVLEALKILEQTDLAGLTHNHAAAIHLQIEAMKLAMEDASFYISDPDHLRIRADDLLSEAYISKQRARISLGRAAQLVLPGNVTGGDTIYCCAVDSAGNAVSLINSIYKAWGTGITVGGTGILLQNRGMAFSLDPGHANVIAPHKRTRHTILPAMVLRDGRPLVTYGFVGGDMQPQGQVQFICNILDFGMNIQDAIDAPRWRYAGEGPRVALETGIGSETRAELAALGHEDIGDDGFFGGGQAILIDREYGSLQGGSDARRDGCAIGY